MARPSRPSNNRSNPRRGGSGKPDRSARPRFERPPREEARAPRAEFTRQERSNERHDSSVPSAPRAKRIAVGVHACLEAVKVRPSEISEIWMVKEWRGNPDLKAIFDLAKTHGISIKEHDKSRLVPLAHSHQGVAVFLQTRPEFEIPTGEEPCLLVALDHVSDPHNLGAVLRSCWLTGVKAILIPKDRSVPLTPAAHKVASGGAEHVPLVEVSNLFQELEELKEKGFWTYAFDASAKSTIWQTKLADKAILVIGSEDKGLRAATLKVCDEKLSLYQAHQSGCYNASVSASLAAFEWVRQKQI